MGIHITHRNRKVRLVGTGMAAQLHRLGEGDLNGSKILGIDVREFSRLSCISPRQIDIKIHIPVFDVICEDQFIAFSRILPSRLAVVLLCQKEDLC